MIDQGTIFALKEISASLKNLIQNLESQVEYDSLRDAEIEAQMTRDEPKDNK